MCVVELQFVKLNGSTLKTQFWFCVLANLSLCVGMSRFVCTQIVDIL